MKFESFFKMNNFKLKSNVMKRIKNKQLILLAGCFLIVSFFYRQFIRKASDLPVTQDEIAQAINNDRWDFTADYAHPFPGKKKHHRQLLCAMP